MDVPFHLLSSDALHPIEHGWFCEAAVQQKRSTGKTYYIQCISWKDKKQVMFLHTIDIRASNGHTVMRSTKGAHFQSVLKSPQSSIELCKAFQCCRQQ
jgi:hypothetical protein